MTFVHPETGEMLECRQDFQDALDEIEEKMKPYYRLRREIQTALATHFEGAALPPPRYRSLTQEKVARCPRCGERLDADSKAD